MEQKLGDSGTDSVFTWTRCSLYIYISERRSQVAQFASATERIPDGRQAVARLSSSVARKRVRVRDECRRVSVSRKRDQSDNIIRELESSQSIFRVINIRSNCIQLIIYYIYFIRFQSWASWSLFSTSQS